MKSRLLSILCLTPLFGSGCFFFGTDDDCTELTGTADLFTTKAVDHCDVLTALQAFRLEYSYYPTAGERYDEVVWELPKGVVQIGQTEQRQALASFRLTPAVADRFEVCGYTQNECSQSPHKCRTFEVVRNDVTGVVDSLPEGRYASWHDVTGEISGPLATGVAIAWKEAAWVFGGRSLEHDRPSAATQILRVDAKTLEYTVAGELPAELQNERLLIGALAGDTLYLSNWTKMWACDMDSLTCDKGETMPAIPFDQGPKQESPKLLHLNGKLYFGPFSLGQPSTFLYEYDIKKQEWTQIEGFANPLPNFNDNMPVAWAATVHDGKLFYGLHSRHVAVFDPQDSTFTLLPKRPPGRIYSLFSADGKLYMTYGGVNASLNEVNPATGALTTHQPLGVCGAKTDITGDQPAEVAVLDDVALFFNYAALQQEYIAWIR